MTNSELKALRGRGHKLNAVVLVGKEGLTASVMAAVDKQLSAHELIKVKLLQACDLNKDDAAKQLASGTQSTLIQRIGKTALLFRPIPDDEEKK